MAQAVRAILSVPDDSLDYATAKLAVDHIIDPSVDVTATAAELDRMAKKARWLARPGADDAARLNTIRRLIYESGPWNGHRHARHHPAGITNIGTIFDVTE